ncbi:MAG TPA: NFACT RNA binding domain-containing protein [Steroidobacteraceae bacterium]|nr:NFACT RNA binding domain-containing protein [Steroidobacteraceae bacterium]
MISNYYILHQVTRELVNSLIGRTFTSAYSVHAGELELVFDDQTSITVILNPARSTIYINRSVHSHPPKRNSIEFFKEIKGSAVKNIEIAHDDKRITFFFEDHLLVIRFYDSPNALLVRDGNVIATFKKEQTKESREQKNKTTLERALPMIGKQLEKEFFVRYPDANNATDEVIKARAKEFDAVLRASRTCLLYHQGERLLLSPIRLNEFTDGKIFDSVSEAIETVVRLRQRTQTLVQKKKILAVRLETIAARSVKAIRDAEAGIETSSRAERYRAIADAISARAHEMTPGAETIEFEFDGRSDHAPLDPKHSVYENAASYYDKARRSIEAKKELTARLAQLRTNEIAVATLVRELEPIESLRELDAFGEKLKTFSFILERSDEHAERSGNELDRFRRFRVAGGFEVLAGKNAKQNDELTMKIAAKEDLWFHARHVSGSHVVLRVAGKKNIPNEAINQAAAIAAYFSEASTQNVVPVAYTKRKFVRKPKGAAPGAVVVEREEVVMVEPKVV